MAALVLLPAGSFRMGSQDRDSSGPNYDPESEWDEQPVHEVVVDGFWIDTREVTNAEFARFVEQTLRSAVANAVERVQVVAAYPITPQTHIVENLSKLVAEGDMHTEFVSVESEFSAASVGGMFGFFFHPGPVESFADAQAADETRFRRFFAAMLERGVYRVVARSVEGFEAESNPLVVSDEAEAILWADLHGHSQLSDGTGTPDQYYRYARDVAGLDVAAARGDLHLLSAQAAELDLGRRHLAPGREEARTEEQDHQHALVGRALDQTKRRMSSADPEPPNEQMPLIGRSVAMQEVYRLTRQVARRKASVLLLGETGTGKSYLSGYLTAAGRATFLPDRRSETTTLIRSFLIERAVADLKKAKGFFSEFLRRAGNQAEFRSSVKDVNTRCAQKPSKKRGAPKCRPGRMQNIDISIEAMQMAS